MRIISGDKMTSNMKRKIVIGFSIASVIIMAFVVGMNIKNMFDSQKLLEESIKSHLDSITAAAEIIIDKDKFETYKSEADINADKTAYGATLAKLRNLRVETNAKYIYAIVQIGAKYYFVFDTDEEADTIFDEYQIYDVHKEAFSGKTVSGIMNVEDEYGSFNTGARPLFRSSDKKVIGIICADTDDSYIKANNTQNLVNIILMLSILVVIFAGLGFVVAYLLNKIKAAQDELRKMAMYDKLTELPNRRFLLEHLAFITARKEKTPFALLFIDLDNFKKVNDSAGHDAGDALLQHIGMYLQGANENSKVFRPGAGAINIAARVGGDEFVLVAPGISTEEEAAEFAKTVLEGFKNAAVDKNIEKYGVGLSIGIALFPTHSFNHHVLIKYADIAMYNTKSKGKNNYSIYNDKMIQKSNN